MVTARELAARVLLSVLEEGGMSHLALNEAFASQPGMEGRDRRFVTALVQGVLENLFPIDAKLSEVSHTPLAKMKPWIRTVLRMSAYQLLYLPTIPASAVCNEAVKLVEKRKMSGLKGFVNGVLRNISRNPKLPQGDLAFQHSMPAWLVEDWQTCYGGKVTGKILSGLGQRHPLAVRRNRSRGSRKEFITLLEKDGVQVTPAPYIEDAYFLQGYDSIDDIEAFRRGLFQIQDLSSMMAGLVAAPAEGARVLDLCAAPGGKSVHLADQVGESGKVVSCDLTPAKVALIRENKERCGFSQLQLEVNDACVLRKEWLGAFDLVMADLPCSGLGTLGHKPEIRYRVSRESICELAELQRQILAQAWQYVKPGGTLVYSTCTIRPEENEDNYRWLLEHAPVVPTSLHPFLPQALHSPTAEQGYLQLLPGVHEACDGFFISRCKRIERG